MGSSSSVSRGSGPGYRRFTLAELQKATSNFDDSELIGKSKGSRTYKGVIVDEQGGSRSTVAVKRYNAQWSNTENMFSNEVLVFSKYRSKYLISLLGICKESGEKIIVYEYMSNGNLAYHLNSKQLRLRSSLSWEQWLKICIDVARGMEFLHHEKLGKRRLVHGQLDSSKILLDQNMAAKLSGFPNTDLRSRVIMPDSLELYGKETNPYVDPYIYLTGRLSQRSDVYAFGMILLEVLCGKLPYRYLYHSQYNKEGEKLRQWAEDNIDTTLKEQISPDCFQMFVDIVEACTSDDLESRPDMDKLVLKLKHVLEFQLKQNYTTSIHVPVVPVKDNEKDKEADNSKKEAQKQKSEGRKSVRFEEPVQEVIQLPPFGIPPADSDSSTLDPTEPATGEDTRDSDDANHSAQEHKPDIISSSPHERFFRQFSLAEIKVATKDFDRKMECGKGGEAVVYRGNILVNDGGAEICVAVKRLNSKAADPKKEIEMLSKMQHENVVSLLGSCQESGEKILVYEYMPNGTLAKYLLRTTSGSRSWEQRLKICIGAASGLEYLHTCPSKSGQGYIHRDVKPVNILLDENWVAKIADFGLAKKCLSDQLVSEMETKRRGTPGYYAPEYLSSGKVTRSIDVYAFGIVMFQVLCRKRPWASHCADSDGSDSDYEGEDIRRWAKENIDKNLKEPISENCLDVFIDVAAKCYDKDKDQRPIMSEVVSKLKYALQLHTGSQVTQFHLLQSDERSFPRHCIVFNCLLAFCVVLVLYSTACSASVLAWFCIQLFARLLCWLGIVFLTVADNCPSYISFS